MNEVQILFRYHSNNTVNRITFHCISGSSFCFLKKLGDQEMRRREIERGMEGRQSNVAPQYNTVRGGTYSPVNLPTTPDTFSLASSFQINSGFS